MTCCFTTLLENLSNITIGSKRLQTPGLCLAPKGFGLGGIFGTPAVTLDRQSYPKVRPIHSPLTTHKGIRRIYSNLDRHSVASYNIQGY
jgi:hypothetical protein